MKGAQPGTADAVAEQLRELLGEARGAVKDLTLLLRQIREATTQGAIAAGKAAHEAFESEMDEAFKQIQDTMNGHAAELNRGVARAREHVMSSLVVSRLEPRPGGKYAVIFEQDKQFVEDGEVYKK